MIAPYMIRVPLGGIMVARILAATIVPRATLSAYPSLRMLGSDMGVNVTAAVNGSPTQAPNAQLATIHE